MARRTSFVTLLVVISGGLAHGSLASAQERWHEQAIEPLPSGGLLVIDDLAFHGEVGFVALRVDDTGHVLRMAFPSDGPPSFSDTGYAETHTYPFGVSFHGGVLSVTQENNQIGLYDESAGGWDTAYAAPENGVVGVLEVDVDGSDRFLATPASLGSEANVYWYDGASWTGHSAGAIETLHLALLASPWAVGVAESGRVYFSVDIAGLPENGAWSLLDASVSALSAFPEESSAAWLDAGAMAAVSASDGGSFAFYLEGLDSGSPLLSDCTDDVVSVAGGGFRRVAAADGVLYALDRAGGVRRISSPADCSRWAEAPASSTSLEDGVGLGAVDGEIAVAVGLAAADAGPVVVWRNRPPTLEAGPDVTLLDEAVTTVTLAVGDPDPDDAARLTVAVECEPGVSASVDGVNVELRADTTFVACSEGSVLARCDVSASDGEKVAEDSLQVSAPCHGGVPVSLPVSVMVPSFAGSVHVSLSVTAPRALALGDVTRVEAELRSSLPFALPGLSVELGDGELAALDDTVELARSSCGAGGSASKQESGLVIDAEGVRAGCPLGFTFLARKGLERSPLGVGRCTWGADENVIADCSGELLLERPRALGCSHTHLRASSSSATSSLLLFGLVLIARGGRRRAPRACSQGDTR